MLLCGRGSRLTPRSPAGAAKKRVSEQFATAEISQAASKLQRGQRAMQGPRVEAGAPKGPESRAANDG
ncbi:hypothetical protein FOXG_21514 [Fusarium oxysporum f. sp. lycopersici 4287]|uniref:Uncharacterized protein n=1 Tax=Fusarium oxysporum f. sp. lycopersici (strain 4287 / CBS 123668 / FGSC 9935 / NRRL 34936) TaxID=426428 RepID=A0A0J9VYK8_FUSO4|nr:hypothetical protein FOXG_21514 [Fusarium oxysporum f. sp. lycopersici 4287]EWZ78770.1 hypothetical protein FOWG_17019 [Fusarium oxysporum f. sp. lycopersici MN25]KNB15861.1 hypothetical protein FOXG_21514 [Fusarium oxysporum f. sp. lycopersici 4287]